MKNRRSGTENTPAAISPPDKFWSDDAELETLLPRLAAAVSIESAPPAVLPRLLAEMRRRDALSPARPPRLSRAALLAGAWSAVLLVLLIMGAAGISLLPRRSPLFPSAHAVLPVGGTHQAAQDPASAFAGGEDAPFLAASSRDSFLLREESGGSPAAPGAGNTAETNSGIFGLPYSDTAIDNGTETTLRVSIPASQLLAWGVPSARGLDDEVPADLLLGDDGLPQAIRILPASATTSSSVYEAYP